MSTAPTRCETTPRRGDARTMACGEYQRLGMHRPGTHIPQIQSDGACMTRRKGLTAFDDKLPPRYRHAGALIRLKPNSGPVLGVTHRPRPLSNSNPPATSSSQELILPYRCDGSSRRLQDPGVLRSMTDRLSGDPVKSHALNPSWNQAGFCPQWGRPSAAPHCLPCDHLVTGPRFHRKPQCGIRTNSPLPSFFLESRQRPR